MAKFNIDPKTAAVIAYGGAGLGSLYANSPQLLEDFENLDIASAVADMGQVLLDGLTAGAATYGITGGKKGIPTALALLAINHAIGAARRASGGHSGAFGSSMIEDRFFYPEENKKSVADLAKEADEKDKKASKKPEQPTAKPSDNATPNNTNTNQIAVKAPNNTVNVEQKKPNTPATKTTSMPRVSQKTGEYYTPKNIIPRKTTNGVPDRTYWSDADEVVIENMRNTADFKRSLQDYANTNLSQGEKERRAAADLLELYRRKQRNQR